MYHKEDNSMTIVRTQTVITKQRIRLYVDRVSLRWIARDEDGSFWALAQNDNPWEHRQAIQSTDQLQLEPVPGHYIHMLGIPG